MGLLLEAAARTASGNAEVGTPASAGVSRADSGVFILDVSAAATDVGDTLDVFVQHSPIPGAWDDFVHFTQVLGNGGAKRFLAGWGRGATPATPLRALADGTLAVGVLQGPVAGLWRVKWTIVDAGTVNASFNFSVHFDPYRVR